MSRSSPGVILDHRHPAKDRLHAFVIVLQEFLLDDTRIRIISLGAIEYQPYPRSVIDLSRPIPILRTYIDFFRTRRIPPWQPIPIILGGKSAE